MGWGEGFPLLCPGTFNSSLCPLTPWSWSTDRSTKGWNRHTVPYGAGVIRTFTPNVWKTWPGSKQAGV